MNNTGKPVSIGEASDPSDGYAAGYRVRERYEEEKRRDESRLSRLAQTTLIHAKKLDLIIEECGLTADPEFRQDLLKDGLCAAIHVLDNVARECYAQDPLGYLADMKVPIGWDIEYGIGVLRGDATVLRVFLSVESRMLTDLGLTSNAVMRTLDAMRHLIVDKEPAFRPHPGGQISELRHELLRDQERLGNPADLHVILQRLARILEGLGGVLMILSEQLMGTITAPVATGLSSHGKALSQAIGVKVLNDRLGRALAESTPGG